jgi:hypothetical protein
MHRELDKQTAIACCAGKAAMDRWYGFKAKSDENWRASDDYQQAHAIALKLSGYDLLGANLADAMV